MIANSSGVSFAGLVEDALADADLADVVQQRADRELLAQLGVEAEPLGHRGDVVGDLLAVAAQERVLGLDRLGEHPDRRDVRAAQLVVQARVLQHRAGVVAEREQHLVVEVLEAALAVDADDDAAELVARRRSGWRRARPRAGSGRARCPPRRSAWRPRSRPASSPKPSWAATLEAGRRRRRARVSSSPRSASTIVSAMRRTSVRTSPQSPSVAALVLQLGDLAAQLAVGLALALVAAREARGAVAQLGDARLVRSTLRGVRELGRAWASSTPTRSRSAARAASTRTGRGGARATRRPVRRAARDRRAEPPQRVLGLVDERLPVRPPATISATSAASEDGSGDQRRRQAPGTRSVRSHGPPLPRWARF